MEPNPAKSFDFNESIIRSCLYKKEVTGDAGNWCVIARRYWRLNHLVSDNEEIDRRSCFAFFILLIEDKNEVNQYVNSDDIECIGDFYRIDNVD